MNAKVKTELLMEIGSNKEGMSKMDLCSKAFEIEQMANIKFPDVRVHFEPLEEKLFDDETMTVVLELARYALATSFTEFAEEADLSDSALVLVRDKLEKVTQGVS